MKRLSPMTSIDELLKYDRTYPDFAPVIICNASRWQRLRRAVLALFGLLTVFAVTVSGACSQSFIDELLALEGTPYTALTCSALINRAHGHRECLAAEMWDGCQGDLAVFEEVSSWRSLHALLPGDVLVVGRVHVAAYLGDGQFIDSVPERGVARFSSVNLNDPWYSGRVRVLRWSNR
jgi:cell wall-associated NlpC family hydrolase